MVEDKHERTFAEYRLLLDHWLRKIDDRLDRIEKRLSELEVDLVSVRIKAGLWGALAGAVPMGITAFLLWMKNSP